MVFFFKQKTAYEMRISDWSSDVCSSDLLHHVDAVTGEVAEFAEDGKTITGGQVWQICDVVERLNLPRVTVETNGIGQFAPAVLRAALKQRGLKCAVVTQDSVARSEEHTSELQSLMRISYAVFCLKKKN